MGDGGHEVNVVTLGLPSSSRALRMSREEVGGFSYRKSRSMNLDTPLQAKMEEETGHEAKMGVFFGGDEVLAADGDLAFCQRDR